jgi:hypothetical protein
VYEISPILPEAQNGRFAAGKLSVRRKDGVYVSVSLGIRSAVKKEERL